MFTKEETEEIIKKKIESDEKLGEHSGGSGHLGYVSYQLMDFISKEIPGDKTQIQYNYSTFVETEFTYEPDNPAYEYKHSKIIIVDKNKVILSEEEVFEENDSVSPSYTDEEWHQAQDEILIYVENFLTQIEWKYGENRAPIKYPPDFYELFSEEHGIDYCCMIEEDFGSDEKLYFKSDNPFHLLDQIKDEFGKRFASDVE